MIGILRWLGLLNAAVWFGASLFFTFVMAQVFFSAEVKQIFPESAFPVYSGRLAAVALARFFVFQHWCGGIAILHALAEWVYLGKPMQKFTLGLLLGLFGLGLAGHFWMQPKMMGIHRVKYSLGSTPDEKAQADKSFKRWHAASQIVNLFVLGGLGFYFFRVNAPANGTRFVSSAKFRG